MQTYFDQLERVRFAGPKTDNPLAFRHYNPDEIVLGKRMADHLRFAACYWHNFCWNGADMFGAGSFERPRQAAGDALEMAKRKADVAFEFFYKLNVPYYCFHDVDVSPEGASLKEYLHNFAIMTEVLAEKQQQTGVKLLWGTANCFTHPRYGAGAATNPDPEVFASGGHAGGDRHERYPPARRRKLCSVGRPRRLRVPAEYRPAPGSVSRLAASCRWWWSTSIRLALAARCLSSRNRRSPPSISTITMSRRCMVS